MGYIRTESSAYPYCIVLRHEINDHVEFFFEGVRQGGGKSSFNLGTRDRWGKFISLLGKTHAELLKVL